MQNASATKQKTRHFDFQQPSTGPTQAQPASARRTPDVETMPDRNPKILLAVNRSLRKAGKALFNAQDMYDLAATHIKTRPEFLGARAERREQMLDSGLTFELANLRKYQKAYKDVQNVLESEMKRVAAGIMIQAPAAPRAHPRTTSRVSFSMAEEFTASQSPTPADPATTQSHTHRRTDPVVGIVQSLTIMHVGPNELSHPFYFLNSNGKVSVHVHTFNSAEATAVSNRPMNLHVDVDTVNARGPKCRPEHTWE